METSTLQIPKELNQNLSKFCNDRGLKKNSLIENLVDYFMNHEEIILEIITTTK